MFAVQSCWGTSIEQDRLNDSLFGTVDLISCKKKVLGNENDKLEDRCISKKKSSIKEKSQRKKKGKYTFDKNYGECNVEDTFKKYDEDVVGSMLICNGNDREKEEVQIGKNRAEVGSGKSVKRKRKRKIGDKETKENLDIGLEKSNSSSCENEEHRFVCDKNNLVIDEPSIKKRKGSTNIDVLVIEESDNQKSSVANELEITESVKKIKNNEAIENHTVGADTKTKKKKRKKKIKKNENSISVLNQNEENEIRNVPDNNSDNCRLTNVIGDNLYEEHRKSKEMCRDINDCAVTEANQPTEYNCNDETLHRNLTYNNTEGTKNVLNLESGIESSNSKIVGKRRKKKNKCKERNGIVLDTCSELKSDPICEGNISTDNDNISTDNIHGENELQVEKTKKKKKRKKKKASVNPIDSNRNNLVSKSLDKEENVIGKQVQSKYNKFQKKITDKLKGAQFRWINEKLYTCESSDAAKMFSSDPKLFDFYHDGFTSQVQQWPQNPVDVISDYIKERDTSLVIADFGCGDAKLARSVSNQVHSFDLVAVNEHVTACDMKKVPLSRNTIDMAVFCLSLMGTNVIDFLIEAHRVIKVGGVIKIAEVKSRFEDTDRFIEDVSSIGFSFIEKDDSNKMFVLLEFQKTEKIPSKKVGEITLKPCIYKRR